MLYLISRGNFYMKNKKIDIKDIKNNQEELNKDYAVVIEENRANLFKEYKKTRTISNILMAVIALVLVGCFIMISNNNQVVQIIGYSLGGASVVGMIVYHLVSKNKFPNKTKEYINLVTKSLNDRAFNGDFKDLVASNDDKLEIPEITSDGVYTNINAIASRNIVKAKLFDRSILVSDLALYEQAGRNRTTHFVGKYISYPNDLVFEGTYVFIRKNMEKSIDDANGISSLSLLLEEDGFYIYGQENSNYKDVFSKKVIDTLKSLTLNDNLLNINIVFWGGHSACYLSYSDAIIALPFDKEFNKEAFEGYVSTQNKVLEIFKSLLNK